MKTIKFFALLVALTLIFAACQKNPLLVSEGFEIPGTQASPNWPLTEDDVADFSPIPGSKWVALPGKENNGDRANASANGSVKLTSHSTPQPPGFMFYWSHQNRHEEYRGYMVVHQKVFDHICSDNPEKEPRLRVTIKQSEKYFDFWVTPDPLAFNEGTNSYVFFSSYVKNIPNSNSINMVFIYAQECVVVCECCGATCCQPPCECGEVCKDCGKKEACCICDDEVPPPTVVTNPIVVNPNPEKCVNEYFIISSPTLLSEKVYEVDPNGVWNGNGLYNGRAPIYTGSHIRDHWSATLNAKHAAFWNDIVKYEAPGGAKPTWIWDTETPWDLGKEGSQVILYTSTFEIPSGAVINEDQVWLRFAVDNAAVVFVNGQIPSATLNNSPDNRGYTSRSIVPGQVPQNPLDGFKTLDCRTFCGQSWEHMYFVDIKPLLKVGEENTIEILAANSANCNCENCRHLVYDETTNPAGLIFSAYFTIDMDPADCKTPCDEFEEEMAEVYGFYRSLYEAQETPVFAEYHFMNLATETLISMYPELGECLGVMSGNDCRFYGYVLRKIKASGGFDPENRVHQYFLERYGDITCAPVVTGINWNNNSSIHQINWIQIDGGQYPSQRLSDLGGLNNFHDGSNYIPHLNWFEEIINGTRETTVDAIFTVLNQNYTQSTAGQLKPYYIRLAFRNGNVWNEYLVDITVNNPGGNNVTTNGLALKGNIYIPKK
jgi:hypothetical protein